MEGVKGCAGLVLSLALLLGIVYVSDVIARSVSDVWIVVFFLRGALVVLGGVAVMFLLAIPAMRTSRQFASCADSSANPRAAESPPASGPENPFFMPRPQDPVWRNVTAQNEPAYQRGFLDIVRRCGLEQAHSSNDLDSETMRRVAETANEAADKDGLIVPILLVLVHQYIDADPLLRATNRSRWVSQMVARQQYAPSPETYVDYIKSNYFGGTL